MKKKLLVLTCAVLILSILLQGCSFALAVLPLALFPSEEPTIADAPPEMLAQPPDYPDYTPFEQDDRGVTPVFEAAEFSDMDYTRPDADALCAAFADVQRMVERGESAQTVLDAYLPVYDDYLVFSTMAALAYIRYSLDLNDEFYTAENDWCDEASPLVMQAMEKLYIAMANSSIRNDLESLHFEDGFFAFYDENQVYSNDNVVKLMQQEADLQNQYMALQSDMTILWDGEERLVEDVLSETVEYEQMLRAYRAYYEKYNPPAADLYVQLIRIRKQIAEELGYPSYAHFAYSYTYERDYTPDQASAYTSSIARELSSLYYSALSSDYTEPMDTDAVMEKLHEAVLRFGGSFATAYDYMTAYDLFDITSSSSKMPGSYVTYLPAYEMPFMYVSPTGDIADFLTASHEFGHFVDGYVNCGSTTAIDCNEVFSQGLEFLMLKRADLSAQQRRDLTASKVADSLLVFLSQACYAEFEQRAYALPDDKLNAQTLNHLFNECNEKYGMGMYGMDDVIGPGWIDIQHFFIAPFYVISYCVSNDAALQIFQEELDDGEGLELYYKLLACSSDNTILSMLEQADMDSPFEEDRMQELADFFIEYLQ